MTTGMTTGSSKTPGRHGRQKYRPLKQALIALAMLATAAWIAALVWTLAPAVFAP